MMDGPLTHKLSETKNMNLVYGVFALPEGRSPWPCWNVTVYIKNSPHSVSPSLTALLNGEAWQLHLMAPCGKSHQL